MVVDVSGGGCEWWWWLVHVRDGEPTPELWRVFLVLALIKASMFSYGAERSL